MQDTKRECNPPDQLLPRVWCDFNACGWSGEVGDDCYYAFDREAIVTNSVIVGDKLFIWDDDGDGNVIGCEALAESFDGQLRFRRVANTWYRGPLDNCRIA
jgi:hypothetical protein